MGGLHRGHEVRRARGQRQVRHGHRGRRRQRRLDPGRHRHHRGAGQGQRDLTTVTGLMPAADSPARQRRPPRRERVGMSVDSIVEREHVVPDVPSITCRLCGSTELRSFLDLGATPPCELFLTAAAVEDAGAHLPAARAGLRALPARPDPAADHARGDVHRVRLLLLVLRPPGCEHARRFVDGAVERLGLGPDSFVVEVASNDGYLLQHVVERGIRCLGIEPSVNVGEAARGQGRAHAHGVPRPGDRHAGARSSTARPTWSCPTTSTPTSPTSSASPRACGRWSPTTAGCRSRSSTCSR